MGWGVITVCWLLEKVSTPKISKLACRQESETERHEKKKGKITDKNDETYSRKYPLCDNDDDDDENDDDDDDDC